MSYTQIFYHIILRTKYSEKILPLDDDNKLYAYIWGILKNKKCTLYRINGMKDHIHLFCSLHPATALSDLIREIKISSNKWLKDEGYNFIGWGDGYAALTYGIEQKEQVVNYIKNQREHHKNVSFIDEYKLFLKTMGVELSEQGMVDFVAPLRGAEE